MNSTASPALAENLAGTPSTLTKDSVSAHSLAETPQSRLDLMFDNDLSTRWHPSSGGQIGGERLKLSFPTPLSLRGLILDTGAFPTDFPRGLQITIPQDCSTPSSPSAVWSFPSWQGGIAVTKDGYPFFTSQSEVKVHFGTVIVATCIEIVQTGHEDHFDWSVAELRIIR